MRNFIYLTALIFVYLIYGLYLARFDVRILSEELVPDPPRGFFDYRGVTNVHTNLSTGSGDLPAVIAAAQTVGLDFLSITDINLFDRPVSVAGYHSDLLVMMDGQYSYLNSRLLNLGATTDRHLQGVGRSQVLFADLLSQRDRDMAVGLFFLSQPMTGPARWSGEYPPGLDGLEIINLKQIWQSAWQKNLFSSLVSLVEFPFNEKLALLRLFQWPDEELRIWDALTQKRHAIGIAGVDADSKVALVGGAYLRFPSYETLFSIVRNHVLLRSELTGKAASDAEKLAHAMGEGQVYMSLDILGNPKGFNAVIKTPSGLVIPMGSKVAWQAGLSLEIYLPQRPKVPFDVMVIRNGERVMTSNVQNTVFPLARPGVYRVMVRVIPTFPLPDGKKWVPWIYTNPFYVGSPSSAPDGTSTTRPGIGGN